MEDEPDHPLDELAGTGVGVAAGLGLSLIPGPLLASFAAVFEMLGERGARNAREAYERRTSRALRAAERVSGRTREQLGAGIADDPCLVPLLTAQILVIPPAVPLDYEHVLHLRTRALAQDNRSSRSAAT